MPERADDMRDPIVLSVVGAVRRRFDLLFTMTSDKADGEPGEEGDRLPPHEQIKRLRECPKLIQNGHDHNLSLRPLGYAERMTRGKRMMISILLGLGYFAVASIAVSTTRFTGGVAFLWGASSLLIAGLAILPRRLWWERLVPCAVASFMATALFGLGWTFALPMMVINMIEGALAAYALRRSRHQTRPLGSLAWLLQFIAAVGVAAPVVAALLAMGVMAVAGHQMAATFWTFFGGHALGNITFTPLALLLLRGDLNKSISQIRRRDAAETILLFLTGSAITTIAFMQNSLPLLFLPILPIMLATFRLGRAGAAVGIATLALIGVTLTAFGHGPAQLIDADPWVRMLFLQFYLAVTVVTVLPVAADLSHRARLMREVRHNAARFRLLAEYSTDIMVHLEVDGRIRYVSPSVRQLGGYDHAMLVGQNCRVMVAPEHLERVQTAHAATIAARGETRTYDYLAITADGAKRWFETHSRAIVDEHGDIDSVLSVVRDISERKATEKRLTDDAMTDALTGLPNRRAFETKVARRPADAARGRLDCVAVLDLDYFKVINDSFGHAVGDRVLRDFAKLARRTVRERDFVARIGGEEFAIFFPDTPVEQAMLVCDRLRREMARTDQRVGSTAVRVTVSGGVGQVGIEGVDHALRAADIALYKAKRSGRDQFALAA